MSQFNKIGIDLEIVPRGASQEIVEEFCREGLAEAEALVRSFIEEVENRKNDVELSCPACSSKDPQFIEIRTLGNVEYQAGVPIFRGRKENIRDVAYYRCTKCNRPFYAEVGRASIQQ